MIKIEYIMTKNMVENVLKKNVSLYTNKILLIFILIFTPITIFLLWILLWNLTYRRYSSCLIYSYIKLINLDSNCLYHYNKEKGKKYL